MNLNNNIIEDNRVTNIIPAVNFHIWKYCNFKCKFCFATYEDQSMLYREKSHLSKEEMLSIIDEISKQGITKITFAGGEPMLCKWLSDLIRHAKQVGLTTMIVTNGFLLTKEWIEAQKSNLDWITLSIDTVNPEYQVAIGRSNKKKFISKYEYLNKISLIKENNIRLKLNTVVCSINSDENLSEFIAEAQPERWKIFQVLPMIGQNDLHIGDLVVSKNDYEAYIKRHNHLKTQGVNIVAENNDLMKGSYLMIDPQGRFYDNNKGKYKYSDSILEVGFEIARKQVIISNEKFINRDGLYNW
ncbi:MAG: viperin family antiviral radical SAM protein [Saprospiraceae bacterium]